MKRSYPEVPNVHYQDQHWEKYNTTCYSHVHQMTQIPKSCVSAIHLRRKTNNALDFFSLLHSNCFCGPSGLCTKHQEKKNTSGTSSTVFRLTEVHACEPQTFQPHELDMT
jgi:hypothetical protein